MRTVSARASITAGNEKIKKILQEEEANEEKRNARNGRARRCYPHCYEVLSHLISFSFIINYY